jgi:hypothetical protein
MNNIISFFKAQIDTQILLHFKEHLRLKLLAIANFSSKSISDAIIDIEASYSNIDKLALFNQTKSEFENMATTRNYDAILRVFNLKNALVANSEVCTLLGIKSSAEYLQLLIYKLRKDDNDSRLLRKAIEAKILKN